MNLLFTLRKEVEKLVKISKVVQIGTWK